MQYALLFYNPPHTEIPERERDGTIGEVLRQMGAWREELVRAGVFRTGLRLAPVDTATSLRAQGGDVLVTDGPFAETKEILGGLVVLDCADLDEALRWARSCPLARIGTVEVRPEWGAASG
jgi:hypothetical protein